MNSRKRRDTQVLYDFEVNKSIPFVLDKWMMERVSPSRASNIKSASGLSKHLIIRVLPIKFRVCFDSPCCQ